MISTQIQTVADEAGHRDAAVLDLGVAQPADGVLVAATPEIGVGEAERVVEADDRVQLDGEGLEVRLGLLDLDGSAGRRRRHEGGRDGQAGKSDGELLRWGWGGELFLSRVDEHANRCVHDCKLVCIQSSDLRSSCGAAMEATHCSRSESARSFPVDVANTRAEHAHVKWLLVLHQGQRLAIAVALRTISNCCRGNRALRRAGLEHGLENLSLFSGVRRAPVQARGRAASL